MKFEKGLATVYIRHKVNEIENLSNEDVQALIGKGDIDTSGIEKGLSEQRRISKARKIYHTQMYDKRTKMINEWIASLNIDKEVLFKPRSNDFLIKK